MNLIAEIKFKKDDEESDNQLLVIVTSIVISIFAILLIRSIETVAICSFIIFLELIFLGKKDGIIRLYENHGIINVRLLDKGVSELQENVSSYKSRWSYNYVPFVKRDVGTPKSTHVNYIFIRLEISLNSGRKIILGKELNQWNSAPTNWEYEVFNQTETDFLGITNHNLVKLKQQMDAVFDKHQNRL